MAPGFSLVECTVMAVLLGCLVIASAWYFQAISSDSRLGIAREELQRIAEEIPRWQLTHKGTPRTTSELPRMGGRELLDPWGTPYWIQADGGHVVSAGPNKLLETTEFSKPLGDDLYARFAAPSAHPSVPDT